MPFSDKQLRSFLAVVEAGSIGSAAERLNITQPTLSRLIHALEERHKADLFERRPSGVVLTDAGETLLSHARLLVFEMEQAANALLALRGLHRGIVRVGAVSAVIQKVIAPAIGRLREASPGLQVQVTENQDDRLLEALRTHRIDLMVCAHVETLGEVSRMGECTFEDSYEVFAAVDHPLANRKTEATIHELATHAWAMTPPGSTPRILFESVLQREKLPLPEITVESRSPEVIAASVVHAGLLGWLPRPLFETELAAGLVCRVPSKAFNLRRNFFIYRRSRGLLSPAAQQFCKVLADSPASNTAKTSTGAGRATSRL